MPRLQQGKQPVQALTLHEGGGGSGRVCVGG